MTEYTIEHKHCGCITTIVGENYRDACKKNNYNPAVWVVVEENKVIEG